MNCVFSCGYTLDVATNGLNSLLVWETYNVETKVLLLGSSLISRFPIWHAHTPTARRGDAMLGLDIPANY